MSSQDVIKDARKDLISVYNESGRLSLYATFIFYDSKGYNKTNMSYTEFCDYFIMALNLDCINTNSQIEVPLICIDKTLYILTLFYNVTTKTDEFGKIVLC